MFFSAAIYKWEKNNFSLFLSLFVFLFVCANTHAQTKQSAYLRERTLDSEYLYSPSAEDGGYFYSIMK